MYDEILCWESTAQYCTIVVFFISNRSLQTFSSKNVHYKLKYYTLYFSSLVFILIK